jgi:protein SCO1/2
MHPDVVSDEPGSCSICGMQLAARDGGGDHGAHDHAADAQGEDPHAHHRAMLSETGYTRSEHHYAIPDLRLVGMDGEPTTLLKELDCGKPVMVNFIFTTCTTICPVQSATFAQVQRDLGPQVDDVRMISISIDPEHDTPERLRAYAERFGAGSQWRFLTGGLSEIIAAQKAFDAYRGSKMSHDPVTFLRASTGAPWVRLYGIAGAADVVEEYRELREN